MRIPFRGALRFVSHTLIVLGVLALLWAFVIWKWNDPITGIYTWYEQGKLAHTYDAHKKAIDTEIESSLPHLSPTAPLTVEQLRIALEARRYRTGSTEGQGIGRIVVPRLGVKMILVNGTDESSLERGPGRDLQTYMPGQGELVYIAGHRTTFLAPFANIQNLRVGDTITLEVPYGTFVYRVFTHVIVPADDIARLKSHGHEVVALQACHPRFFATNRYIVYGRLVQVTPTHGRPFRLVNGKPLPLENTKPTAAKQK